MDSPAEIRCSQADVATGVIERLDIVGARRVRAGVVEDLLPRPLPTCLDEREIAELERRLWQLELFDDVAVRRHGAVLEVAVHEKWTLVPGADFSAGSTLRDSFFLASLTESNLFGRAQYVELVGYYAEREPGVYVFWGEQDQAARRVTFEAHAEYDGSSIFFEDDTYAWTHRRAGGGVGLRFPARYRTQLRSALLFSGYREVSEGTVPAGIPDEGVYGGMTARVAWDHYTFHDLAPHGFIVTTELKPGTFFTPIGARNRSSATVHATSAVRISETAALLVGTVVESAVPGDPNHAHLLGTLHGVRGLADGLYRDSVHAFVNVELRFAKEIVKRWFLQGVTFVDAAVYARMNEHGATQRPGAALGAGVGVRVVPTAIAGLVPRLDVGYLLHPERSPFVTFGISQYF